MTEYTLTVERKNGKKNTHIAFGIVILFSFILILSSSDTAIEYMKKGLRLCAITVIPSLFPFMVISELMVTSGIGARISKIFAKPMHLLFGVGATGTAAYLLGTVCGFPIGAKTAISMYDNGMIDRHEAERLLTFCNNPGSAFVISAVGVSLFGNKHIGILMYTCVIISSVIIGILGKLIFQRHKVKDKPDITLITPEFGIKNITDAVQTSALSMLTVCAYVVFFSAFVGCIGALLSRLSIPEELVACIFGFFELSGGVGAGAGIENRYYALLLCSLFVGWSGLSVHFQIMSVCSGRDISFKPYFIAKAAQSVICAALTMISVKCFFPFLLIGNSPVYSPLPVIQDMIPRYICIALFISSAIFAIIGKIKYVKSKDRK